MPRHILLTTDFSPDAERAFPLAAELAQRLGAEITLLHVVVELQAIPQGAPMAPPHPAPDIDMLLRTAEAQLLRDADKLPGVKVTTRAVPGGDVVTTITGEAARSGADLIVLSTHGRTGLRRLVLGSVAESVVRHARTPVLCVPAK